MDETQIAQMIQDALDERERLNELRISPIALHTHNRSDSPLVAKENFTNILWQYNAKEFVKTGVTGTATVDWSISNVQYFTLTGNTTLSFINPQPGMRCILHIAGAFTPTWPGTVRWPAGTTPTATAGAGKKDLYAFVYSGQESLYDGIGSLNFATT